ncbi:hypothetical protein IJ732_06820 [bacterium]|nr:hypothetical protein [bacterium]
MFEDLIDNIGNKFRSLQLPPEIRQNFEAFLSKMGASTRKTVAVSFSPNIGVEMLEIDNLANIITRYAVRPLAYDSANRRMESYTDFANCISELFEEFEISSNSNVILSLPNIHFGLMEIPPILHGDTIRNVILSEVEQSYLFRANEPLVTWYNLSKGKKEKNRPNMVLYSAIQKDVIDGILEACQNVGCRFLTIETSHLSALRGLSFLGLITDQVKENLVWQLMIIEANVFSIITMQGNTPVSYFEEPLALKSFEEDEIYKSIAEAAIDVINSDKIINNEKKQSTSLLIVSQTDLVSAEVLKNQLEANQPIDILECNKYSSQELYPTSYQVPPDMAEQISLTSIGAAAFLFYNYPISLNYIKETVEERQNIDDQIGNIKVNLGNIELNITRDTIRRLALIFASIFLLPLFVVQLVLGQVLLPKERQKSNELASKIEAVNNEINNLTQSGPQTTFDINQAAKKSVNQNKTLLFQYSTVGEIIPKNLWVTHTEEKDNDFLISGVAVSTRTIYDFYKNVKTMLKDKNLILTKLEFTNENIDSYVTAMGKIPSTLYGFEISSSKDLTKSDAVKTTFNVTEQPNLFAEEKSETTEVGGVTTSVAPVPKGQLQNQNAQTGDAANPDMPAGGSGELPAYLKEIKE